MSKHEVEPPGDGRPPSSPPRARRTARPGRPQGAARPRPVSRCSSTRSARWPRRASVDVVVVAAPAERGVTAVGTTCCSRSLGETELHVVRRRRDASAVGGAAPWPRCPTTSTSCWSTTPPAPCVPDERDRRRHRRGARAGRRRRAGRPGRRHRQAGRRRRSRRGHRRPLALRAAQTPQGFARIVLGVRAPRRRRARARGRHRRRRARGALRSPGHGRSPAPRRRSR